MADHLADPALVVCAVVVFHDGTATQRASVAAAAAQDAPPDLELDLVDVIVAPDDHAARNRAIRRTKGSYVAVIDGGAAPDERWLSSSIAALRDDPTLGLVAPGNGDADARSYVIDPDATSFVARRSMWAATGGYDEKVGASTQGLSLGWRCWLLGWRAALVGDHGTTRTDAPVPRGDLAHLAATLLRHPGTLRSGRRFAGLGRGGRRTLQRARRRPDSELGVLLTRAMEGDEALAELRGVLADRGADHVLGTRRTVIVATADTLAPSMAGPAIRAWRVATALATEHDVHLVTTGSCSLEERRFPVERVDDERLAELAATADMFVFQGWVMADRPWLVESDLVVVADVYDPMHLEQLEHGRDATAEGGRARAITGANDTLNQQFRRGDYFLCASPKQRDLWLGQLAGVGRVNQVTYDEDNSFTERMRIVPFGIDDAEPTSSRHAIRDAHPAIGPDDEIILWGGGIYNWFDPITLIHAVDRLRRTRATVRLYFLGTRHPNPEIPEMQMAVAARRLADDLGLLDTHVFFNDGWVPYDERADYLLDADVAVSIHLAHIETEFSFRTRMLDYLWCGLPIVATAGDSFEALIEEHELGECVTPGDVGALEAALERLLDDPERRARAAANARRLAEEFRWDRVLEPIREICRNPTRAPDVACPDTAPVVDETETLPAWREDLGLARRYVAEGGFSLLMRRGRSRIARLRAGSD